MREKPTNLVLVCESIMTVTVMSPGEGEKWRVFLCEGGQACHGAPACGSSVIDKLPARLDPLNIDLRQLSQVITH